MKRTLFSFFLILVGQLNILFESQFILVISTHCLFDTYIDCQENSTVSVTLTKIRQNSLFPIVYS